jgi:hypothetical protein
LAGDVKASGCAWRGSFNERLALSKGSIEDKAACSARLASGAPVAQSHRGCRAVVIDGQQTGRRCRRCSGGPVGVSREMQMQIRTKQGVLGHDSCPCRRAWLAWLATARGSWSWSWSWACSWAASLPPPALASRLQRRHLHTPRASWHRRIFRPHAANSHSRRGPQPRLRGVPVRPCLKMPAEGALRCSPRRPHHSIQEPTCSFPRYRRQHEVPRWCVPLSSTHPLQGQS